MAADSVQSMDVLVGGVSENYRVFGSKNEEQGKLRNHSN
jgi:hypothetical protein